MKVIIWNTDTFEKCQKYEEILHKAVYADFVSLLSSEILKELNEIYNEVLGTNGVFNVNCGGCVVTALQRLGIRYFNEKSNRKLNEKEDGRVKETKVKEEPNKTKPKNKGGRPKGSKNKNQGSSKGKGSTKP